MTRTDSPLRGGRRGVFLVQAMVLVMILAIVAAGMLWLNFGRHVLISRANAAESDQQLAAAVQGQVMACLDGSTYGSADCSQGTLDGLLKACSIPATIGGKTWSISTNNQPGSCQFNITIND
jgi:hypothetical protein